MERLRKLNCELDKEKKFSK